MRSSIFLGILGLLLAAAFALPAQDDGNPAPPAPAPDAGNAAGGNNANAQRQRRRNQNARQGQPQGQNAPGQAGGPGGQGGQGGFNRGGMGAMMGGMGGMTAMMSRMLGVDLDNAKDPLHLSALPLGADERFIRNVPVGGVDKPIGTGTGWKMEAILPLTDEQLKGVDKLRDEYQADQKKLADEIAPQLKTVAEKVKALRQKYEDKANNLLAAADKDSKVKMDAVMREYTAQKAAVLAELLPMYDLEDQTQAMAFARAVRDKLTPLMQDVQAKLLEAAPAAAKDKLEEAIRNQDDMLNRAARMGGGQGRPNNEAVKPPAPPDPVPNF